MLTPSVKTPLCCLMPSQETLSSVVNVIPTTEEKTPSFTVAVDWFFFFFFFSVAALCPPGSTYSPMTNSCIYLAAESHYPFFDTKTRTCSCCRWPRAIDTKELRRPERERERQRVRQQSLSSSVNWSRADRTRQ